MSTWPGARSDLSRWWDDHDKGTGDRPRPGTRVLIRDGRSGTVQPYEGCWKSCTFPVLVDRTMQSLMLSTSDVTELATGGKPADAVEDAG
ncbi:hypothetical protein F4560_000085 [Saccharothrix ecbatanensis]|uniref:Uncharacterized protein n=1 Tax=Saccharothrix ecbatanensis TaxID=1105145 RepID=A0A7W9HDK6_9PSEU|nr:hypothetical protein [Saccharothrix ecbatanensis]MBB5800317.1 hypothetical protein [Saccharothrix ecbatanensis]